MLELGGQQPSSAMISMNQLTTGHHLANRRTGRKKTTGIPNPKRMFEEVKCFIKILREAFKKRYTENIMNLALKEGGCLT